MTGSATPRVSVITPTYNRADFIGEAVQSVMDQDYTDFELLIVDDGSTDNTREVLQPWLQDERVHYIQQANQGQSHARNRAIEQARGEFICFLDSDNAWVPGKLSMQVALLDEHPEVDVVYGDNIFINEAGAETSRQNMKRYSGFIAFQMLKDNCVAMNTTMARRRCFDEMGGMSGKRRVADDYDLWLRFSARYRFHYMPEYLAYYRVMEQQISSDKTARFETNEAIIRDFRDQFPDVLPRKRFDEAFAFFYTRKARYLAASGQRGLAWREILTALRYRPFSRVAWRGLAAITVKR
ncbi:glycosyl transferase [Halovibrio salipaludis]|uniref:Glycosyl transferase n=1 Tax=Halovibrio salipaludis TaxID=2032626 RepID=A0A2A2F6L7_9GAMM|nr:glycosyltransferase [Halovibrio salipaludis]PAU81201.1 glycosyl transferase [Halovibrio salipaludis]